MKFDWDFTNVLTKIPYLGTALGVTNAFVRAMELGELVTKLEVKGQIGLSSDRFALRTRHIPDKAVTNKLTKLKLNGEIGITLKATASAKKQVDIWKLQCGGDAKAEAGIKAKLADTETIIGDIYAAYSAKLNEADRAEFQRNAGDPEYKESRFRIEDGRPVLDAKIGFSGLAVYTYTYAQMSCSKTHYRAAAPTYFDRKEDSVLTQTSGSSGKSGYTKTWGDDRDKIQIVVGANPKIWNPHINLFGQK